VKDHCSPQSDLSGYRSWKGWMCFETRVGIALAVIRQGRRNWLEHRRPQRKFEACTFIQGIIIHSFTAVQSLEDSNR
jgi:hypothetical protein